MRPKRNRLERARTSVERTADLVDALGGLTTALIRLVRRTTVLVVAIGTLVWTVRMQL